MVRGANDRVWAEDGREFIDLYGGHCVCVTGHCHPYVVKAIQDQAEKLVFYSTAGDLEIRERAAAVLAKAAGLNSVFFCNSGAEANENALKIATKITGRTRFAAFEGGWHGRAILPLSVTDDPAISLPYTDFLAPCERLPRDERAFSVDFSQIAAIILEPIQSISGVQEFPAEFLAKLRKKCTESGTLLIFDEIQTGVGRLGAPFASRLHGVVPDIVTAAKGIASGIPLGATVMSQSVADQLRPGDLGSTFGGGPIACAALLATFEVLEVEKLAENSLRQERRIREGCPLPVRGRGLLLGLDAGDHAKALRAHFFDDGILVGGSHDPAILRLLPPLTLTDESVDRFLASLQKYFA